MLRHIKFFGWVGIMALLALFALSKTELNGDGGEYLMMTHALARHGTPEIRPADVQEILQAPPRAGVAIPRQMFEAIIAQTGTAHPVAQGGFFPNPEGRYYAIHFWLYSLLAVPFYVLLKLFGLTPVWAFGLLNLSFAGAVLFYLRRAMPQQFWIGFALFAAMGTTFYLPWSGPEVMSAACALIAAIAMLRGDAGLAMLMSGLGASQNPPLIFMMPFIVGCRALLQRWPQLGWPGITLGALGRRDVLMALAGIVLALIPYAFFQLTFGMPSVIGHYSTSQELISANRFFSLFADLDQGMLVGLPGLVGALLLVVLLVKVPRRSSWLLTVALVLTIVVVMAIPTLSAMNWNPGGIVMLRYNYWLGMVLLALVLLGLVRMPNGRLAFIPWIAIALQVPVWATFGVFGEHSRHTQHTPLASWVLNHAPERYNPDPEIFYERSVGREEGMSLDLIHLYSHDGKPLKLLRHWSNFTNNAGLCPAGSLLRGHDVHTVDKGWQYLHAPFDCLPGQSHEQLGIWPIGQPDPNGRKLLTAGWSSIEGAGVWSDAIESTLTVPVPAGKQAMRVLTVGHYFGAQRDTVVTINGRELGSYRLSDGNFVLPAELRKDGVLKIVLRHPSATSPLARGESPDGRILGFYLEAIALDTAPL